MLQFVASIQGKSAYIVSLQCKQQNTGPGSSFTLKEHLNIDIKLAHIILLIPKLK